MSSRNNSLIARSMILDPFFLLLLLVSPAAGFVTTVATYGFSLNVGLGSFNMLPIPPIDGYKIFKNNIDLDPIF